jgi:RecJ-like exonuclease
MSKQIVTGDSLEDQIGNLHEEDIALEFAGTHPDQLIVDCYYRGSVDGYSDFGIFVNIGEYVTGLLHRSELPGRLESIDWEVGETVYVQVKNVRDNGNVDLGWSLRMSESEFRGNFVHDPEGTLDPEDLEDESEESVSAEPPTGDTQPDQRKEATTVEPEQDLEQGQEQEHTPDEEQTQDTSQEASADIERAEITTLDKQVGNLVRLEGNVTNIRQTSGPTVFTLQDETESVDCAAFEGAGVRAYPEVDENDFVRIDGEVRERRGELQIETEQLTVLSDEAATEVSDRMEKAIAAEAEADEVEPIASDAAVEAVLDEVREAATAIRRAVIESRPIVVRHEASIDGYLAGAAIEHAVVPLIESEHTDADSAYHLFNRRPLDRTYDMNDATNDVASMLDAQDRHEQKRPLFVFAATGSTRDSLDGFDLLRIYDAEALVIDNETDADGAITDTVSTLVNPGLAGSDDDTSATALATAIAVHVNNSIRDDLRHLPAASFWENTPDIYVDLAAENDYRTEDVEHLQESIALEAYYQSYDGKRELVADLLFEESAGLREQVSEQFREKLASEVETAEENLDRRSEGGVAFAVLDTDAFTHRFDFPSTDLLLDDIHRRNRDGTFVTLGIGENEIIIRSTAPVDVGEVAQQVEENVPNAGITARDGLGRIEFVIGKRERVIEGTVDAIADTI